MVLEPDEVLFAQEYVHCVGQIVGVILANSPELAVQAADLVHVSYVELEAVITIGNAPPFLICLQFSTLGGVSIFP